MASLTGLESSIGVIVMGFNAGCPGLRPFMPETKKATRFTDDLIYLWRPQSRHSAWLLPRMECGMSRTPAINPGNKKGRQIYWRPYKFVASPRVPVIYHCLSETINLNWEGFEDHLSYSDWIGYDFSGKIVIRCITTTAFEINRKLLI